MVLRKALLCLLNAQIFGAGLASFLAGQTLQITTPATGIVVAPGQTVPVSVSASDGTFSQVGIVAEDPIDFSNLLTTGPYQFSIAIPTTISVGTYRLTAVGSADQAALIQSQPVTLYVETPDNPIGISLQPATLIFEAQGQQVPLLVSASYSGGTTRDVSHSSQLSYSSSNPAVVSVNNNGVVTSVGQGTASISVSYGRAASAAVPVSVQSLTFTASPASLSFPNTNLGATSTAQAVTVTNTGGAGLALTSVTVSGDFTETDSCAGKTLAAGDSCTMNVVYAPASIGQESGQLTLVNSLDVVPLAVLLDGTGVSTTTGTLVANLSHAGELNKGQSGVTYSLSVQNAGTVSFSGTALVQETLPATLTLNSLSGPGWTCTVSLAQCSRSDVLAAGASYPGLVAAVNVSATAPQSVSNSATLSYTSGTDSAIYSTTDTAQVLPLMQTIAFGPLNNPTMGIAPFSISATASSGLPVTFTSTTTAVCTVAGSAVTIVAVGNCSITASQSGDETVPAAASVTQGFTVSAAWQIITFGTLSDVAFGGSASALRATASSSLSVTFASNSAAVCTVSGTTVSLLTAGTCSITASQVGNATYLAADPVTRSFTVSPPPASCDINQDAVTNVADVQLIINEALGVSAATDDLNHDGSVNVADVQKVINAALGLGCSVP